MRVPLLFADISVTRLKLNVIPPKGLTFECQLLVHQYANYPHHVTEVQVNLSYECTKFISVCVTGSCTVHTTKSRPVLQVYHSSASVVTGQHRNSACNYTILLLQYLCGILTGAFVSHFDRFQTKTNVIPHATHCTEQHYKTFAQARNRQQTMGGLVTTVSRHPQRVLYRRFDVSYLLITKAA